MELLVFKQLFLSFLLGLLVGIQRERVGTRLAGMRTFPMISVFGTLCGLMAQKTDPENGYAFWLIAAGLLCLTLVAVIPHLVYLFSYISLRITKDEGTPAAPIDTAQDIDLGVTTLMAILLMFLVGVLMTLPAMNGVAVAVGGGVALLLHFKLELHGIARRLADTDMKAIMQFVLITCIILPVLPNRTFGPEPYQVINPFESWMMVVLIVGMSLFGYIIYMFLGRDAGMLLAGVLGGSISSTATTVSSCRQVVDQPSYQRVAAITIMIASTVVFGRVILETFVVCPDFAMTALGPLLVMMCSVLIPALALWFAVRKEPSQMPEQKNPTQLKSAITFGLLYTFVLFVMAVARSNAGEYGMMVVAGLSGLTDMDAITLSTARMAAAELAAAELAAAADAGAASTLASTASDSLLNGGWKLLIIAAMGNLLFKLGIIGTMAGRAMMGMIAKLFLIPFTVGLLLLFFWP